MKKQTNQRWQTLLLASIATFIIFGATSSAFAQKSLNSKYPPPDFSAMAEYWEVVSYEYDFTGGGVPWFTIVAKKKVDKAPRGWDIVWRDADGVKIFAGVFMFDTINAAKVGETVRSSSHAPWKDEMLKVKTIVLSENMSLE